MKTYFLALLLAGMVSVSQSAVIGDFETGMDNWSIFQPSLTTLTIVSTPGTVTSGQKSLAVKVPSPQYWAIQWNAPAVPASMTNAKLTFDLTMIASEWTNYPWTEAGKVSFACGGNWTEWIPTAVDRTTGLPTSTDWGPWLGDFKKTIIVDIPSYNTDTAGVPGFQISIALQHSASAATDIGNFYIDNIQLVPEPATMLILGLGTLAFLRKKK